MGHEYNKGLNDDPPPYSFRELELSPEFPTCLTCGEFTVPEPPGQPNGQFQPLVSYWMNFAAHSRLKQLRHIVGHE